MLKHKKCKLFSLKFQWIEKDVNKVCNIFTGSCDRNIMMQFAVSKGCNTGRADFRLINQMTILTTVLGEPV